MRQEDRDAKQTTIDALEFLTAEALAHAPAHAGDEEQVELVKEAAAVVRRALKLVPRWDD